MVRFSSVQLSSAQFSCVGLLQLFDYALFIYAEFYSTLPASHPTPYILHHTPYPATVPQTQQYPAKVEHANQCDNKKSGPGSSSSLSEYRVSLPFLSDIFSEVELELRLLMKEDC